MITARSLASNFSIQLLGKLLSMIVGLLAIAIMTRVLGTQGFGEYTTAVTYLQMFGVVVDFGLTLTLVVMISEVGVDEERIVGNFFGLRLLSGFLLFSLAPISILALPYSRTVQSAVLVGSLAYFLMGGATMLVGVFQKHQSMWRAALAETINRLVLLGLVCLFALLHPGVVEMVLASVAANAIWLWAMICFAKPFVQITPMFQWSVWSYIFKRSWPIALSIIFNLLYLKGDILFLAFYRDASEVGIYGVAYRILDVLTVLPVMFMGLILPSLVTAWSTGHVQEFKILVKRTFDLFMLALIPIVVGAQIVATDLTVLIAGQNFAEAGPILSWLIFAVIGIYMSALFGHLIVAVNKQRIMTWGYLTVAILSIVGYLWLIPDYGMWGAVWITLFSEGFISILTFIVVLKTSHVLPNLTVTLKALLSALLMFVILSQFPNTHVIPQMIIGAGIYTLGVIALKAVNLKEVMRLFKPRSV